MNDVEVINNQSVFLKYEKIMSKIISFRVVFSPIFSYTHEGQNMQ